MFVCFCNKTNLLVIHLPQKKKEQVDVLRLLKTCAGKLICFQCVVLTPGHVGELWRRVDPTPLEKREERRERGGEKARARLKIHDMHFSTSARYTASIMS